jgi:hypothetical protein
MNKEIAYRKILRCSNKDQTRNLSIFLGKAKYKLFNKEKKCKYVS